MTMRNEDGQGARAAERIGEGVRNLSDDMSQNASQTYDQARHAVEDTMETVRQRGDELIETLSDYVATKPMTSLGIAAAIGYFMGRMGGRR